jgi:hypothetical protein
MPVPNIYTAGQILEATSLNTNFASVFYGYTAFTPTMTGWTQGNATFNTQYAVSGETVHYYGEMVMGSTSAVTVSALALSLPVAANTSPPHWGFGTWIDVSAGVSVAGRVQVAVPLASTMLTYWEDPEAAPLAVRLEPWNTSVVLPFTFATGDYFRWNLFYRKA